MFKISDHKPAGPTVITEAMKLPYKQRIAADETLIRALQLRGEVKKVWCAVHDKVDHHINPHRMRNYHKGAAESAVDPDERERHAVNYANSNDVAAVELLKDAGKREIFGQFGLWKDANSHPVERALQLIPALRAEVVAAETEFLARFGLPYEPTSAVRIVEEIERELLHFREAVNAPWTRPASVPSRSIYAEIGKWFEDIPSAPRVEQKGQSVLRKAAGMATAFAGAVVAVWPK